MKRALSIGDIVCIREEAVASVRATHPHVQAHRPYRIDDVETSLGRRVFYLKDGALYAYAWPSEVHLADGAAEKLHARKVALHKQLAEERDAARAARAKRFPKKKGKRK